MSSLLNVICSEMESSNVTSSLTGMRTNLVGLRKKLTKQIRREMKVIKTGEGLLKTMKVSVAKLKNRRKWIERSLMDLVDVRNALTNEVECYEPSSSASEIDTDQLSSTSEESDCDIKVSQF